MELTADLNTSPGLTRRTFFSGVIYVLWGLIAAALGVPAMAYLLLPPRQGRSSQWSVAGNVPVLTPDRPVEVAFDATRIDGWRVTTERTTAWVVKTGDTLFALGPRCTHLGCAYHWEDASHHFVCPCHASVFSIDGKVLSGPAPRPLDRYETRVQNGRLLIGPLHESGEAGA